MRSQSIFGLVLVVAGLVLLFLLRGVLFQLILLILGAIGVFVGLVLVLGGLAMIFWPRRRW